MSLSPLFFRILFSALSLLLFTLASKSMTGLVIGVAFTLALVGLEPLLKKWHPRHFFLTVLALFFGVLLGQGIFLLLAAVFPAETESLSLLHVALLLGGTFVAMGVVTAAAEEVVVSLPFIHLKATGQKKKDLLMDTSVLADPRILDLALSGILDGHLLLPRFLVKELQTLGDDAKAKICLETVKKLEAMDTLEMKVIDTDFSEIKEISCKLVKLARAIDANLLTADINRIQQAEIQGIKIINLHLLANALKPINQSGEWLDIKIQRHGKELTQGVGYLEDGTMVVVNGGADFMGLTIRCQVLSVKHSGTGRLIFCNAPDEGELKDSLDRMENSPSHYFVSDYERHRL